MTHIDLVFVKSADFWNDNKEVLIGGGIGGGIGAITGGLMAGVDDDDTLSEALRKRLKTAVAGLVLGGGTGAGAGYLYKNLGVGKTLDNAAGALGNAINPPPTQPAPPPQKNKEDSDGIVGTLNNLAGETTSYIGESLINPDTTLIAAPIVAGTAAGAYGTIKGMQNNAYDKPIQDIELKIEKGIERADQLHSRINAEDTSNTSTLNRAKDRASGSNAQALAVTAEINEVKNQLALDPKNEKLKNKLSELEIREAALDQIAFSDDLRVQAVESELKTPMSDRYSPELKLIELLNTENLDKLNLLEAKRRGMFGRRGNIKAGISEGSKNAAKWGGIATLISLLTSGISSALTKDDE